MQLAIEWLKVSLRVFARGLWLHDYFFNKISDLYTEFATEVEEGFVIKDPEYEASYSIIILPDFISLPYSSTEIPEMAGSGWITCSCQCQKKGRGRSLDC